MFVRGVLLAAARTARLAIPQITRPAQLVVSGFAGAVLVGTLLLWLPIATEGDGHGGAPVASAAFTALFTAVSAVCVTGLVVVDTAGHWSTFGEVVILALIQVGGFGIMAFASLLGLLVARRLRLRAQITAQTETKSLDLGDVRRVLVGVASSTLVIEAVTAAALALRFAFGYGEPAGRAAYLGVFHAVSSFNNAGFALWQDNLIGFATDPWICLPIAAAVILGGLGFPVLLEIRREVRTAAGARRRGSRGRPRPLARWSLHSKITLLTTAALLVGGTVAFLAGEWTNPATLGRLDIADKLLVGFFHSVMPRTAGFNAIDYGQANGATLLVTDVLMFIGGGSAGTAGGIKVTTFALLGFVILTEIRGDPETHAFGRTIPASAQRQALTVALLSVGLLVLGTLAVLAVAPHPLEPVLFEVTSAFATVGLSTGITADLPISAQSILAALMFIGRLGPITLATALALRESGRRYQLPEERPIVG